MNQTILFYIFEWINSFSESKMLMVTNDWYFAKIMSVTIKVVEYFDSKGEVIQQFDQHFLNFSHHLV